MGLVNNADFPLLRRGTAAQIGGQTVGGSDAYSNRRQTLTLGTARPAQSTTTPEGRFLDQRNRDDSWGLCRFGFTKSGTTGISVGEALSRATGRWRVGTLTSPAR